MIVFDKLSFEKRFKLLQMMDNDNLDPVFLILRNYIYQYLFEFDDEKYLLFSKDNDILLLEKTDNKWVEASAFMKKETSNTIKDKFNIDVANMGDYLGVGFYKIESKKEEFKFKIKDTHKPRATGVICNVMYKNDLMELIESQFSQYSFSSTLRNSQTIHICLLIQILFRYNQYTSYENKLWFLSPTYTQIFKKYINTIKL